MYGCGLKLISVAGRSAENYVSRAMCRFFATGTSCPAPAIISSSALRRRPSVVSLPSSVLVCSQNMKSLPVVCLLTSHVSHSNPARRHRGWADVMQRP